MFRMLYVLCRALHGESGCLHRYRMRPNASGCVNGNLGFRIPTYVGKSLLPNVLDKTNTGETRKCVLSANRGVGWGISLFSGDCDGVISRRATLKWRPPNLNVPNALFDQTGVTKKLGTMSGIIDTPA